MKRNYFYLLDLLRFFAALAVLFWHYQHFIGTRSDSPLYNIFWPFYEYGDLAVHLFWVISGFVFASVYINNRSTIRKFVISRFARLYPLHFVTLLAVALLQLINLNYFGEFKIYEFNDLYHFILNVFFISEWGFQEGRSFNAPIWSVSVEILVYAIFAMVLPLLMRFRYLTASLLITSMLLLNYIGFPGQVFWLCGSFFFVGTLTYLFYEDGLIKNNFLYILLPTLVAYFVFPTKLFAEIVLFAAAIFFVVYCERFTSKYSTTWPRFGDLSYGVYLWHIPIQLTLILGIGIFGFDNGTVEMNSFLLTYLISVIMTAYLGFKFIEKPASNLIKRLDQI